MNTAEKAYKEILKALNKYKSEIVFDVDDLERKAKHQERTNTYAGKESRNK